MTKIKELNERRAAVVAQRKALTTAAEQRSDASLTAEEREAFNKLVEERDGIDADLRVFEAMEAEDKRSASAKVAERKADNNAELEERAFMKYVANKELTAEERTALTMSNSGVIVPNSIQQDVLIGLQGTYGILSAIDLKYTDDSATMTFPYIISSMTLQKVAVGSTTSEGEAQWKGLQLTANDFKLPTIPVSRTLLLAGGVDARAALVGLVDKNGRPLYIESMAAGVPDKLFGHPVVIDDAMPEIAAQANVILFGDMKAYKARIVRGIEVATYDESKYREQGCVGMQAFVTGDGRLMYEDGKIEPIAMLAMAKA